jgi:N-acetylmuramoyl-L-alanine amidase
LITGTQVEDVPSGVKITLQLQGTDVETFASLNAMSGDQNGPIAETQSASDALDSNPVVVPKGAQRVVVLDPGHGGIDPGAVGANGTLEKVVVLDFAIALKAALEKTSGVKVYLTRDGDKFIPLLKRARIGHLNKADLFISIHADTLIGKQAKGLTFYTLSEKASDEESQALADKENKVDTMAGIKVAMENPDVADILVDLLQRESKNHAVLVATKATQHVKKVTKLAGKPLRSAGFTVLRSPDVPSLLIELGFLSSNEDEKRLLSADWREKTAGAIASAIGEYFSEEIAVNAITRAASP